MPEEGWFVRGPPPNSGLAHPTQTCANPNPQPAYPLNNVRNGKATTVINVPLTKLEAGQYYVNIHKSAKDFTVVSCADIPTS